MAQFHPAGDTGDPHFTYSPYVRPITSGGIRGVFVDKYLRGIEPKTSDFVLDFTHDNSLQLVGACTLPEGSASAKA